MRTSFHHQSEAQPPNGRLTAATSRGSCFSPGGILSSRIHVRHHQPIRASNLPSITRPVLPHRGPLRIGHNKLTRRDQS